MLYQVDIDSLAVLLYGSVQAWWTLDEGMTGPDMPQLNHDLVALGYASATDVSALGRDYFSWETGYGVQLMESALGVGSPPGSPSVADKAGVVTIPHNDVDALEDLCRHRQIAYVADGVCSLGVRVPIGELLRLQANVNLFDILVETAECGDGLLIRLVRVGSEEAAVALAQDLLSSALFAPPLFFPIIDRGRAGLSVMLRANMSAEEIEEFCGLINILLQRGPVAAGAGR